MTVPAPPRPAAGSPAVAAPPPVPPAPAPRVLTRSSRGRLLAGVAAGIGEHLGVDPLYVRLAFAGLVLTGGAGVFAYAIFWAVLPAGPGAALQPCPRRRPRPRARALLVAGCAVALLGAASTWLTTVSSGAVLWPLMLAGVGAALLWRQADDGQRQRWLAPGARLVAAGPGRRRALLRLGVGVLLVVGGAAGFLAAHSQLSQVRAGLLATVVVVGGLALITGPWWWRLATELGAERRERIRSQERAEIAAQVHDSVLHTLTLIQRHVDEPREVARLARSQERALRSWLYRPPGRPAEAFAAAVEAVAAEVEDAHRVPVEVVSVGDAPLDERLAATVQAAREAMVNAAKASGADAVSVYAEVEAGQVSVFVRDRGKGFDLEAVPEDRFGIRRSIVGRMQRHGGSAEIRTAPGEGTEVALVMPRTTA